MASDAQIKANRENSRLSTGPKTDQGKAASALNGHRHIGLARAIILVTECPIRFCEMIDDFYDEYQPVTPTERSLVDLLVTARWRQLRMANLEAAAVNKAWARQLTALTDAAETTTEAYAAEMKNSRAIDVFGRSEARVQRQFDSAFNRLQVLRRNRLSEANSKASKY